MIASLVVALAVPGIAFGLVAGSPRTDAIPVALGDVVRVSGTPVGCIVRRQNGERALDCRKMGPLTGTYGAILTKRQIMVVRFHDRTTAKIVFSAHHRRLRAHVCG